MVNPRKTARRGRNLLLIIPDLPAKNSYVEGNIEFATYDWQAQSVLEQEKLNARKARTSLPGRCSWKI
jgi:hypothetical protein